MPPFVSSIEIARPPAEVFAYACDPTRFPQWQDDVVSVRMEEDRPPSLGTRFTTIRRIGHIEYKTTQEITEFSPPRSFTAGSVDGPVRAIGSITVEPIEDGTQSRVTFELDFQGQGMGKLLVPDVLRRLAEKRAPTSYRNLKQQLETGATLPTDRTPG
jgi:uncharacterized protein YndB with AHSA1/START domain